MTAQVTDADIDFRLPADPDHPLYADEAAVRSGVGELFEVFDARLESRIAPPDFVPLLIPGSGITMWHGQPRDYKTWLALETAIAAAAGCAPFGLEQFRVHRPRRTWYVTEEDPEVEVRSRVRCLLAGRDRQLDKTLHVSVQKSISLDDVGWQREIYDYAQQHAIEATFFDPIRSLSTAVDQGPDKLAPLAAFLRRYMRDTGGVVNIVHHDTKPLVGKPDERARPQRASGGGIFSIADAPIHVERPSGSEPRTIVTPSHYKFAIAPEPFVVTLESDDPKRPTWVRLSGQGSTATAAVELALHEQVIDYLREHPGTSGTKIAKGLHRNKQDVLNALGDLRLKGRADFYLRGQANVWSLIQTQGAL